MNLKILKGKKEKFSWAEIRKIKKEKRPLSMVDELPWDFHIKQIDYFSGSDGTQLSSERCIIVNKDMSLMTVYGFRGNDIECFSGDYINGVYEYFNACIKQLGDGWMVSVEAQRFQTKEYPAASFSNVAALLVDREREASYKADGEHYDSGFYLIFVYKPESETKKKLENMFFKEPEHKTLMSTEIKNFTEKVQGITGVMSNRLIIAPLDTQQTYQFLHSTCSMTRHPFLIPDDDSLLFIDNVISDQSIEIGKTCRLGNYYIPIVDVYDFPQQSYPGIFNILNKLNIEYRWVTRYFPLNKEEAIHLLTKQQNAKFNEKVNFKQSMAMVTMNAAPKTENPAATVEQSDVEQCIVDVQTDAEGFGYYQSSVMVWDTDLTAARKKMATVIETMQNIGYTARESDFNSFESFLGMNAGNTTGNMVRWPMKSGVCANLLPLSAVWSGIEHNKHIGELTGCDAPLIEVSTNYGTNFHFNINEDDVGHTKVIGPTGAGKSFLLNLMAVSALKYPDAQVFIMDYGLSFLTLTLAVGGTYINPDENQVCFQPFRDIDKPAEFEWAVDLVQTIVDLAGVKRDQNINLAIESAMQALRLMPKDQRGFTEYCMGLQYYDKDGVNILDVALKPYCIGGRFGHIFDGHETSLKMDFWTMFEMESTMNLGQQALAPMIICIFHFVENAMTGRLTFFFMDECWFGLDNPIIAPRMKKYLLTLRKKNVFCIFATQNPAAFATSSIAAEMKQNCPTTVFLADPKAHDNEEAYSALGLTGEEINLLSLCTKKRDYYYKGTFGTRLFQLNAGPLEQALFKSYQSNFLYNGERIQWRKYLAYLLQQKAAGKKNVFVEEILTQQKIDYKQYLYKQDNYEEFIW